MMTKISPLALFRLSVLGPLASRDKFEHGELKRIIQELASRTYDIPGSDRHRVSVASIEHWFYRWKRGGIEALEPRTRCDAGQTTLDPTCQTAIIQCKTENSKRSLTQIQRILERSGIAALGKLSRSTLHRFLKSMGLSRCKGDAKESIERRTFCAERCGDIWYGDVMHGPTVPVGKNLRKVYLVTLMDDASRLLVHSEFCLGEKALDIENVLKQAILKRGLPKKLVVDNGAAYRSHTLQAICARLEIRLVFCRPHDPQSKGKLERFHRFARGAFLNELDSRQLKDLSDLNARLWAWIESEYHRKPHGGLEGMTPLDRWQKDLIHIRPLGSFSSKLEEVFYHYYPRKVRKDGALSYGGQFYEVPYEIAGDSVILVVDPHQNKPIRIESKIGAFLGAVTPLDAIANLNRRRCRPTELPHKSEIPKTFNMVEMAFEQYTDALKINDTQTKED